MAIDIKEQFPNGDIIELENEAQHFYSDLLGALVNHAREHGEDQPELVSYLRGIWDGESWESILKKCDTEGSVWYVWWMDGVSALVEDSEKFAREQEGDPDGNLSDKED
jgi:hypothetical protein